MKVLLVGSGAREHALAWKLAQSPLIHALVSLPGNPGMNGLGETAPAVTADDVDAIAAYAEVGRFDLVVVGPEAPLAAGLVDSLEEHRVPTFGPTRQAARLESSKAFAKQIMIEAGVATAGAATVTDREAALAALNATAGPYVVKADGLAAGKGVLVSESRDEAMAWVDRCLEGGFGSAGRTVVIEEFLEGPEISVFALCDGTDAVTLVPAQDYKRLREGDDGPNTGGMGSFSPVSPDDDLLTRRVLDHVIRPVVAVMADRGTPFTGILYAGLVLTPEGPQVLEFNVRLGDPEAQVVLPRLEGDLLELMVACRDGNIGSMTVGSSPRSAVNVVLAADGYPENPRAGDPIRGLEQAEQQEDVLVFHAGTAVSNETVITAGGRVLSIVGLGPDLEAARTKAYRAVEAIDFEGMRHRRDIARQS